MDTTRKHDWGLIVAGILLVLCAFFFVVAPGLTLVTITAIAGAAFLVSGIFDIINYVRFHKVMNLSGWAIAYAVLDIVIGLMFLIHPLAFAGVIPWVIGAFFIIFGAFEVVGHRERGVRHHVLRGASVVQHIPLGVHTHARRVARILRLEREQGHAGVAGGRALPQPLMKPWGGCAARCDSW